MTVTRDHPDGLDAEVFTANQLRVFTERVFARLGMRAEDATLLADHLVWAELRGQSAIGLKKIPQYAARLQQRGTKPTGGLVVVEARGAFTVVDADDTFAQVAGVRAMQMAVETARVDGVGTVVVRNTTSAGALGYYANVAVGQRMIGMAINNTPPVMAASGGREGALGAQAFAVGSPTGGLMPLLLDMSISNTSHSRILDYEHRGEKLPEGLALDASGRPTVDPQEALAGILLPMAGHRGYGLALMWEVLTGILAGGSRYANNVGMPADHGRPQGTSMFLLAIDPTVVMPYDDFTARVDWFVDHLHGTQPADADQAILVPGERGEAMAAERELHGVPVAAPMLETLRELASELGVAAP